MKRTRTAMLGLLAAGLAGGAERWEMQYFYDDARATFNIRDMVFASPKRGIAVGVTVQNEKRRGAAAITSDAGERWTMMPLPEPAISVFFLDDSLGWLVTEKGLYQTDEGGRSWRKINAPKEVLRVHFLTPQHGFAVGVKKSIFETRDGGKHWARVPAADQPKARPEFTVYSWISFLNPQIGIITGWNRPPRARDAQALPEWIDPESAASRAEWPSVSISFETQDGGRNWRFAQSSIFGRVSRVRLCADGRSLWLIEFVDSHPYPSEVAMVTWKNSGSSRVFRDKQCAITDMAIMPGGPAYLAGIRVPGALQRAPVPGKVRILRSADMASWSDMEVDYRAVGRRVVMASTDPQNLWVGTDTGMILKLRR